MISFLRRAFVLACWACCNFISPAASAAGVEAAPAAHQFDFMVGQWQVTGEVKIVGIMALIHGTPKLTGTWKAWRMQDDSGIEDDLTLADAAGNVNSAVHYTRTFLRQDSSWKISGRDAYNGHPPVATGHWQGDKMLVMGGGTSSEGKHYQSRTAYVAITPSSFRVIQDRSYDEGKTWDTGVVTLNVTRVAAK